MDRFHIIVLVVATTIFILLFGFMIVYYKYPKDMYPNVGDACPDYWIVNPDNTCQIPTNGFNTGDLSKQTYNYADFTKSDQKITKNQYGNKIYSRKPSTGTYTAYSSEQIPFGYYLQNPTDPSPTSINFNDPGWVSYSNSGTRICGIKKWANQHQIQWDWVSYYNKCI
jgi:hypothetical protein